MGGPRARRSNMHFTSSSTGGLSSSQSSYSPSNREAMDPIAGKNQSTLFFFWSLSPHLAITSNITIAQLFAVSVLFRYMHILLAPGRRFKLM